MHEEKAVRPDLGQGLDRPEFIAEPSEPSTPEHRYGVRKDREKNNPLARQNR